MHAAAVRAFGNQHIASLDRRRIDQQRHVATTEVTREDNSLHLAIVVFDFKFRDCRPEDVSCRVEPQSDIRGEFVPLAEEQRLHMAEQLLDVLLGVERLDAGVPRPELAGQVLCVFELDAGRVEQHQLGDVGGGIGAEDRSAKPFPVEHRNAAAVIDVRVREDDRVEVLWAAAQFLILAAGLGTTALKQAAVQQNPPMPGLDQVLAAGDLAGGTEEGDFHAGTFANLASAVEMRRRQVERGRCKRLVCLWFGASRQRAATRRDTGTS